MSLYATFIRDRWPLINTGGFQRLLLPRETGKVCE